MNPLVTCLCLTRSRREWLPKAIACFLVQTYEPKELLIVADGPSDVWGLIPDAKNIRVAYASGMVGFKRNWGCWEARGELIAVWDDDDWSASGRLTAQVKAIQRTGLAVTGFRDLKFTDGRQWWQWLGWDNFAIATSLMFQKDWWADHRFREVQSGQDEAFATQAFQLGQLAVEPDRNLMYATIHPGNTSPRNPNGPQWKELPEFEWSDGEAA